MRRSDEEAEAIRNSALAMAAAINDAPALLEHDLAFHLAIAKAARNPVFSLIVGAFEGATRQTWPIGWRSRSTEAEQRVMLGYHLDIAEAIRAGDPQAAQANMALHFDESVRALLVAGLA
jgi:DNA-binding FadR family transcriptional regulator